MTKKDPRRFYVYAYLRSKDSEHGKRLTPYYIGKGHGNRAFCRNQRTCPAPVEDYYIVFVQEGLTEEEAFGLEKYCIALYGRIDNGSGILRNRTDGGEGTSGRIVSPDEIKRLSIISRGRKLSRATRMKMSKSQLGRKHSKETKVKMSKKATGAGNAFYGKNHSEDARNKMSASRMGHAVSEETRKKMSRSKIGNRHTDESRAKISLARQKREYQVTLPDGQVHITKSLSAFAEDRLLPRWALFESAKKDGKTFRGISVIILRNL
jgi:hypothetical protein